MSKIDLSQISSQLRSIVKSLEELDTEKQQQTFRIMHLKNNPVEMEVRKKQMELDEVKNENGRLKARLKLLESGNDGDVTSRIDDYINNAHRIEVLSQKVDELKMRENKILDSFKKTSREFREVCYLLTGFRIDALKDRVYRLSSMYAESEEDKLFFEIAPDGTVQLLKNEFADRLSPYVRTYLEKSDSFPAFLASITMDLFKSTTQLDNSTCMSMVMSTTIQPNPEYKPSR